MESGERTIDDWIGDHVCEPMWDRLECAAQRLDNFCETRPFSVFGIIITIIVITEVI